MEVRNNDGRHLERSSSQTSSASRKSGTVRTKPRKQSLVTPSSAKTLESFPSLSPEASPGLHQGVSLLSRPTVASPTEETPRRPTKTRPSIVESLVTSSPSFKGRSALFEDSLTGSHNGLPGSLHHASDEHIQSLIQKKGAVSLVRQLALDLADRDSEMTALRRRAEERERELKRMLREVEVSNLDIEKRLHRLEGPEDSVASKGSPAQPYFGTDGSRERPGKKSTEINGLDQMMGEAMKDEVGLTEIDEGYLDSLDEHDRQATVRARSVLSKESDVKSVASSVDSQGRRIGTVRAWKDYLWSNNATNSKSSKASSVTDYQEEESLDHDRRLSTINGRRKGLNEDLFSPPTNNIPKTETPTPQARKASSSVANWTMKLFAGNVQSGRDGDDSTTRRGRASSAGSQTQASRGASRQSGKVPPVPPIPQSAKDALMKVNSVDTSRTNKSTITPKLGPNSITKSQQAANNIPLSPAVVDNVSNLGPVEMDTIHPPDSRPPTLSQVSHRTASSGDLLTDRFGFIYDQRRRKKEAEASIAISHNRGKSNASANIEFIKSTRDALKPKDGEQASAPLKADSIKRPETPLSSEERGDEQPAKKWQDYLKVATFPTELLSHTPAVQPSTAVVSPESPIAQLKRSTTSGESRTSLPSLSTNPEPELTSVTVGKAELSTTSTTTTSPISSTPVLSKPVETEPVKLLLAQLTDLHDTLQREKTVKWNEFLRKVRAERKKEGENAAASDPSSRSKQSAAATPEVSLTDGEMIGVAGLGNKGKVGRAKWKEFKHLVLGGIPVAYRAKIWAECSGASALRVPGYYDDLVAGNGSSENKNVAGEVDDPATLAQIQMDIHRTLTDNVFFRAGPGVNKLHEVLLAYSRRNPVVGYCQGMNMIAASLLLIMPTAEDAFWLLTSLIENILPQHYYDHSLLASRADQQVLRQYVADLLPKLSAHLDELGIELEALTFQWFLSVFTDCLSAEALFRVWDVVLSFNDGSTFLFQVALALLKLNETQLLECDTPARVYGYIGNEMTDHAISIDGLIGASEALKKVVTRTEVEERRWAAVEEQRGKERGRVRGGSGSTSTTGAESATATVSDELRMQEPRPFEG